jgi:hypothetical protein
MAQQTINIGTEANDGTGDPLRTAFDKTNDNFDELYVEKAALAGADFTGAVDVAGGLTVGGDTHYAEFATDGTLTLNGDATYWDDLSFPLTQGKQGNTTKPDYSYTELGYLFPQNDADEILYLSVQLPHRWKIGSTIYPHIHWHQSADQNVTWKIDYRWFNIGESVPGVWSTYTMDGLVIAYTSGNVHQISRNVLGIDGTGKTLSSCLQIKLYRDDNVYTGDALATMFDIHIECDALGSSQEFVK